MQEQLTTEINLLSKLHKCSVLKGSGENRTNMGPPKKFQQFQKFLNMFIKILLELRKYFEKIWGDFGYIL